MRFIRHLFDKLINLLTERYGPLEKKSLKDIDLSDLFTEDAESTAGSILMKDDFKSFSSPADYNREFLSVFHLHKKDVFLDLNHKDGHFRV